MELSPSPWNNTNFTAATNDAVAPDGTTTAEKFTNNGTGTNRSVYQAFTSTAAAYTYSLFVKQGTSAICRVGLYDVSAGWLHLATFTFATESMATTSGSGTYGSQKLSNGWYRIWVTGTFPAGASDRAYFYASTTDGVSGADGDSVYAWGAQIELGAYPSSYIPTTTATVARAADAVRLINAGVFAPLANEGSLLWVGRYPCASQPAVTVIGVGLNSADSGANSIQLARGQNNVASWFSIMNSDNVQQTSQPGLVAAANTLMAALVTWQTNNVKLYFNGALTATDTSATMPLALDRLEIGSRHSADPRSGGKQFLVAAFDRALTDAEAKTLTSNPEALK